MLNLYTVLLSIHIIAAVVWIGGGTALTILMSRLRGERDTKILARLFADVGALGQRVFLPASLVLLAAGFGLIAEGDWEWKLWIILGIAGWLTTAVNGALFMGPQSAKLGELLASGTAESQAVDARLRRVLMFGSAELAIMMLVIVDMVVKPGT